MQAVLEPKAMVAARKEGNKCTILGAYTKDTNLVVLFADLKGYTVPICIQDDLCLLPGNKLMDGDTCINELLFDRIADEVSKCVT